MHGVGLAEPIGDWRDHNWLLPMNEIMVGGDDMKRGYAGLSADPGYPAPTL